MQYNIIAIIAILFFAFITNIQAECAWVLWKRFELRPNNPPSQWEVQSATSKEEQCRQRMEETIKQQLDFYAKTGKTADRYTFTPGIASVVQEIGRHAQLGVDVRYISEYTCLPDTIRPSSR